MKQSASLVRRGSLLACCLLLASCGTTGHRVLVTIADARTQAAKVVDIGEPGDSVGDVIVFDQPLLGAEGAVIGINSGTCIRTRVGHSSQCQWTLKFDDGTIQVAGREADQGASAIAIVGGTGAYSNISGEMTSVNNNDGTFTQTLEYRLK